MINYKVRNDIDFIGVSNIQEFGVEATITVDELKYSKSTAEKALAKEIETLVDFVDNGLPSGKIKYGPAKVDIFDYYEDDKWYSRVKIPVQYNDVKSRDKSVWIMYGATVIIPYDPNPNRYVIVLDLPDGDNITSVVLVCQNEYFTITDVIDRVNFILTKTTSEYKNSKLGVDGLIMKIINECRGENGHLTGFKVTAMNTSTIEGVYRK